MYRSPMLFLATLHDVLPFKVAASRMRADKEEQTKMHHALADALADSADAPPSARDAIPKGVVSSARDLHLGLNEIGLFNEASSRRPPVIIPKGAVSTARELAINADKELVARLEVELVAQQDRGQADRKAAERLPIREEALDEKPKTNENPPKQWAKNRRNTGRRLA